MLKTKYLLPLILILLLTFTLIGDCWVSGYDQRIKLTIDHTKIDATLSNFPATAFFTDAQAEEIFAEFDADEDFDRGQFALDDDTLLYADCELFDDSASLGIYHFKVTSVSSSAGTDIYFYYDNDAAHNTTYISTSGDTAAQSVWDANFKAVYHMNDVVIVYDTQYEATVEPDSDGWALVGTDYSSVSAGILTIDTSANDSYTCYYYKAPDIDFDAGFYLKAKIKASINMIEDTDHLNLLISDGTQNEYTKISIYNGKIIVFRSGGYSSYAIDTTTDYVVYEIYIKGTDLKVYADGVLKASLTVDSSVSDDRVWFGDNNADLFAKAEMDYLYYALGVVDNPVDTVNTILDSTSNNNDGTKKGTDEPVEATGKVGQGQQYDGTNDDINCGAGATLNISGNITLETIAKFSTSQNNRPLISRWGADHSYVLLIPGTPNDDKIRATIMVSDTSKRATSVGTYDDNAWHYYVGRWDGSNVLLNIDSTVETITGDATAGPIDTPADIDLILGAYIDNPTSNVFNGIIDEIRISSTSRNSTWIKATYNTLWDSLLTYGSEETAAVKTNIMFIFGDF